MTRALAALALIASLALGLGPAARAASPFADWAAVVVAGDFHAHNGSLSIRCSLG